MSGVCFGCDGRQVAALAPEHPQLVSHGTPVSTSGGDVKSVFWSFQDNRSSQFDPHLVSHRTARGTTGGNKAASLKSVVWTQDNRSSGGRKNFILLRGVISIYI